MWVQLEGTNQRGPRDRDGRADSAHAVIEKLSLRLRVPMLMHMEDMVMDGPPELIMEKMSGKWPELVCTIWPAVMASVASQWLDSGQSEDKARNVAKIGCMVRRIKLLVSSGGEAQYCTPVGLARLVEEEYAVQVVAVVTRTQTVEGMNQLGHLLQPK